MYGDKSLICQKYLNVCYKHLPSLLQQEWDEFDTDGFDHSWIAFMNTNAKAALKKRTLVESLKDMTDDTKVKKGGKVIAAVGSVRTGDDRNDTSTGDFSEKQKEKYQDLKQKAGNCKLCKVMHTLQSRSAGQSNALIIETAK